MLFLGRSTGLATLAILLPATKGKKKIGFTVWNVITYLLMSIIMVIMVGVLGNAIQTQMFPMPVSYTHLAGVTVLVIKLQTPKSAPNMAPFLGPSTIEPVSYTHLKYGCRCPNMVQYTRVY